MDICGQVFVLMCYLGYVPRSGIGCMVTLHLTLRTCLGCFPFLSWQRCTKGSTFCTSLSPFGIFCHFNFATKLDVQWHLIVMLICISLVLRILSIFSCAYWLLIFFGEVFIQILCAFLSWIIYFFNYWVVRIIYIIQISVPYQINRFANIFPHSVDCSFTLLLSIISSTKVFNFNEILSSFFFEVCAFVVICKTSLSNPRSWRWRTYVFF